MAPSIDNPPIILKYRIDDKFAANFDELVNIDVSNRKSDTWFTERTKLMIKMRPGTTQIGDTLTWWTGTSRQFFYTDFAKVRRHYRGYNNHLYYNNSWTWTDIWTFSGNDLNFNTVKLPLMINWSTPTTYTTPSQSAGAERVKLSASDPQFGISGWNVWNTLIIISDTVYKWVFWTIIANDWVDYTLLGSGIIQALNAWATYKVYDTTWEYLQVTDWLSNDRYFQWITEHTPFAWFATASLRLIKGITSSQYIKKQVAFNFSMWSFNKTTLYYSAGTINNPFFHNVSGVYSLPFSGDILDIFTFKNRLIVWGTNFVVAINRNLTYDIVSSSFGIKQWSLVDLGQDMYFLSSTGYIKSLSENIVWTIISTDIWEQVHNYTKNFLSSVVSWFDGRKMYLYWQPDWSTAGIIVVFDLVYKYWSTYTWLRPSSILTEDWITYLTANNTDKVSKFDPTVTRDLWVAWSIEQKIVTKEIDLGDTFMIKEFKDMYFWLENYTQDSFCYVYAALPNQNSLIYQKSLTVAERVQPAIPAPPLGWWELGENVLGWDGFTSSISYPFIFKNVFPVDKANIWKVAIIWKDWSPFYLNEFDVTLKISGEKRAYFSPSYTT